MVDDAVVEFVRDIMNKETSLKRFLSGIKGIGTTIEKEDESLKKILTIESKNFISSIKSLKELDKDTIADLIDKFTKQIKSHFSQYLKNIRDLRNAYVVSVNNLCSKIIDLDNTTSDKIIELINNITQEYDNEINKLKVQVANLVDELETYKERYNAIKENRPEQPKVIPSKPEQKTVTIRCPVCLQEYQVDPNIEQYKCEVCSNVFDVASHVVKKEE